MDEKKKMIIAHCFKIELTKKEAINAFKCIGFNAHEKQVLIPNLGEVDMFFWNEHELQSVVKVINELDAQRVNMEYLINEQTLINEWKQQR